MAKGRASPHCITWIYRKKRHRKYFRSRIDALRFRNEKEQELGVRDRHEIENEIIFWALSEIKERLDGIEERVGNLEANFLEQGEHLKAMLATRSQGSESGRSGQSPSGFFKEIVLPFG